MRLVVVGGGIAGLATALACARDGHEVVILERDDTPMPPDPDAAFRWQRTGAPQVRHSHAFLARLRNHLRDEAPDVLEALFAAGATEIPFTAELPETLTDRSPMPGDDELVAIACRRTTFEWVLRRLVLATPGVTLEHGRAVSRLDAVAGRLAAAGSGGTAVPRVAGVDGMTADLVVDARGPRSSSDDWLASIGSRPVAERLHESGIVYFSRFYRVRDGGSLPALAVPVAADLGYLKFAVFLGDNATFSITFAVERDDATLRRAFADAEVFEAAARAIESLALWRAGDASEPITDVHVMAGLRNRCRPLVDDDGPLVTGFVAVGDASVCTNPLYGRGCSLAVVHGFGLAGTLRSHGSDLDAIAREHAAFTERELVPWFRSAVFQDTHTRELLEPGDDTGSASESTDDPRAFMHAVFRDGLMPAMRTSPIVFRAFLRWFNLLVTPDALVSDAAVVGEVFAAFHARDERPSLLPAGPDRDELLAELAAETSGAEVQEVQ